MVAVVMTPVVTVVVVIAPMIEIERVEQIAGMFTGTQGLSSSITGFGKLSRLRFESLPRSVVAAETTAPNPARGRAGHAGRRRRG
jgi:hypothetical protein